MRTGLTPPTHLMWRRQLCGIRIGPILTLAIVFKCDPQIRQLLDKTVARAVLLGRLALRVLHRRYDCPTRDPSCSSKAIGVLLHCFSAHILCFNPKKDCCIIWFRCYITPPVQLPRPCGKAFKFQQVPLACHLAHAMTSVTVLSVLHQGGQRRVLPTCQKGFCPIQVTPGTCMASEEE